MAGYTSFIVGVQSYALVHMYDRSTIDHDKSNFLITIYAVNVG